MLAGHFARSAGGLLHAGNEMLAGRRRFGFGLDGIVSVGILLLELFELLIEA